MVAVDFAAGGYRFIPASSNIRAARRRFRLRDPACPVPAGGAGGAGLSEIARIITAAGRPLTSFCACELRSPAPFSDDGFRAFNQATW